ncbi:MAG: RNA polymerase sigma factor [Verrucomicrobiae bacterium]|nr:RNA polymerase sigma factor [Verrucomicrobiae bacterium]MCP5541633.1 RNA polymerase sigma factor [Akkermansiaceae bacterium]
MNPERMPDGENEPNPRDPAGFDELVRTHHRELLVYARALTHDVNTAREIVQDAFVLAHEKIDTFDVTRDFAAWMRGILRNKWREWLRRNRRHELPENALAEMDAAVSLWQAGRAVRNATVFDALEQCQERLPEHLRAAVHACYYRGETGDEAAASLGIAPAAVRKRLQRARDMLRECVERKMETQSQSPGDSAIF